MNLPPSPEGAHYATVFTADNDGDYYAAVILLPDDADTAVEANDRFDLQDATYLRKISRAMPSLAARSEAIAKAEEIGIPYEDEPLSSEWWLPFPEANGDS